MGNFIKQFLTNSFLLVSLAVLGLFAAMYATIDHASLLLIMNSLFIGGLVSLAVAFTQLIYVSITDTHDYDRASQIAIAIFVLWLSSGVGAINSVYIRSVAEASAPPVYFLTLLSRYLSIVAAVLMVTAPDFGSGMFSYRERRILWASLGVGAIVAAVLLYVQGSSL